MRTATGSYSDPGVQRELKRLQAQNDLLSRRLDKQPKIPPPVAAAGGGGPQGFTRATARGVDYNPSYGRWNFSNWEIDSSYSKAPGPTPGIFSVATTSVVGRLAPAQAGWIWQKVRVATDANASRLTLSVNPEGAAGGVDNASYYTSRTITPNVLGTFEDVAWLGPFWLPDHTGTGYSPLGIDINHPTGESVTYSWFEVEIDFIS